MTTSNSSTTELLHCPCCGSTATAMRNEARWWVECDGCGLHTPTDNFGDPVKCWNTRTATPPHDKSCDCPLHRLSKEERAVKIDEAIDEAMAHPEDVCHKCGGPNVVWFGPKDIWNGAIRGQGEPEIICPTCFIQLAEAAGYITVVWRVAPYGFYRKERQVEISKGATL